MVTRLRMATLCTILMTALLGLDAGAQTTVEQAITPNTTLQASLASQSSLDVMHFSNDAQVSQGVLTLLIEDERGTYLGWEVTLHASDFRLITGSTEATLPAAGFRLGSPGHLTPELGSADGIAFAAPGVALGTEQVVLQASPGSGTGRYLVHLNVALDIPPQTPAGAYTSSITVDISSAPGT